MNPTAKTSLCRELLGCGEKLTLLLVCSFAERHRHEIENGRTSSISEHTIGMMHRLKHGAIAVRTLTRWFYCGVDAGIAQDGRFTSTDDFDANDFREGDDAEGDTRSFITFSDLAGHEKYLKITGLESCLFCSPTLMMRRKQVCWMRSRC